MSEIPEHLLARSRARRAAMGGGGGDAAPAAATAATTESDAPAPVEQAATPAVPVDTTPAEPDPVPPWVEAAQTRQKIPIWAVPVLALLPLWAVVYALTLDTPTPTEAGPIELGSEVYNGNGCSGCHGGDGGGIGANPALIGDGNVNEVFPSPADQVTWVALATAGYAAAGIEEYAHGRPVGGGGNMPPWIDALTGEELMSAVLHERSTLNDEEFDAAVWEDGFEETLSALLPADKVDEYVAVLEEWKADPPEAP